MIHVKLPEGMPQQHLPFYLAMEEWIADSLPADDYFFTWQVEPTVIFGRNQSIDLEVNLGYCKANGIEVYRRRSGGGCVFADMHNIMFSYITPSEKVETTFSRYTEMIATMLKSLGLNAEASGRNDITIDGRKVSGNSFYHKPGRSIVHGTMLFDTDFNHMAAAITPSRSKMMSKQVQSVESRITTLSRHLSMDIDSFHRYAIENLTDAAVGLDVNDIKEIERLSMPYYNHEWIYGRHSDRINRHERRIEGVGEFDVSVDTQNGIIKHINLYGDFFIIGDLDNLLNKLHGVVYDRESINEALRDIDCSQIIAGLTTDSFVDLIIQ